MRPGLTLNWAWRQGGLGVSGVTPSGLLFGKISLATLGQQEHERPERRQRGQFLAITRAGRAFTKAGTEGQIEVTVRREAGQS